MEVKIRRVKIGDEKTLAYIQTESWKAAFNDILKESVLERCTELDKSIDMYYNLLKNNIGNGYILEVDNKPHCISYWDSSREKDMDGYAELICIHSLKEKWHMGYGKKMLDGVLEDMRLKGFKKVMLWVFNENKRAISFYEKNGFRPNGKRKETLGTVEVMYERTL